MNKAILPFDHQSFNFHASNIKRAIKNIFMRRNPSKVVISPHMGLGDHLVCIGLVKEVVRIYSGMTFYYTCSHGAYKTLSWAYNDCKNLFLMPIQSKREAVQLSGFLNAFFLPLDVDTNVISNYEEVFYQKFGFPFVLRWEGARVPPSPNSDSLYDRLNPSGEPYILVCNLQSDSIRYDLAITNNGNKKVIYVEPITDNLYDWTRLTAGADEIHTIDTSYIHFVESYFYHCGEAPVLYFHKARPTSTTFTRKLSWEEVEYL
jgi:hypothetical protein